MRPARDEDYRERHLWEIQPVRDLLIFLILALLIWSVYQLAHILLPVFLAFVLADILNPLIVFFRRKFNCPRALTAAVIILLSLLTLSGMLAWLGPLLYQQFSALTDRLPVYVETLEKSYGIDVGSMINTPLHNLQNEPRKLLGQIFSTTGQAVGIITAILSTASYTLISFMLFVLYFFLIAWHFETGIDHLKRFIPQNRKARILSIVNRMDQALTDFFRGRLVIAIIIGIVLSAGWFLTNVPYWFFLGMLTGFLNIVPYLSIISWPLAILVKYFEAVANDGESIGFLSIVVWPSAVYIGVQLLDNYLLTPWVQSGQTNLGAATILIVVLIGGALAGVWGLIFAIPAAACIKILLQEFVIPRLRSWAATH